MTHDRTLLPRGRRLFACVAATALAAALSGTSAAADDASTYGSTVTVTPGQNSHSAIPVALDLPALGNGLRVEKLTFRWSQPNPTGQGNTQQGDYVADTPDCVPDTSCHVDVTLPTARIPNGVPTISLAVTAIDGATESLAGTRSFQIEVNNPKPTAVLTAPDDRSTVWGTVTLTADGTPGTDGAPLKGVRFYLNPGGLDTDPYLFDDTAPYAVEVPALDIAPVTGTRRLVAAAEDVEGNLSVYQYAPYPTLPMQRWLSVGPPPLVSWWTPGGQDRQAGSMGGSALLGWQTALPDTAPAMPDAPNDPFIARVEILMDGQPLWDMPYDKAAPWADFQAGVKKRTASYSHFWSAATGATAGRHTATLRVTTSYGSVASTDLRFIMGDGVTFLPVTSAGRRVDNGFVVTAGKTTRFAATAAAKVPRSVLVFWDMTTSDGQSPAGGGNGCLRTGWWNCAERHTISGDWVAPATPGRYTLSFSAQLYDDAVTSVSRTIVVQPRGVAHVAVSRTVVRRGAPVTVTGRLTRADTGRGVAGIPVTLQWRPTGQQSWLSLKTVDSGRYGQLAATASRSRTGVYRWTTPGVRGTLSAATSPGVTVTVR